MDFRPSRMAVVAKHVEAFIREFFDQNPLSHIGLITIKDGVAQSLTDLGGSPDSHIKALMGKLGCSGDSSLQNALDLIHGFLNQIPSYGHREVLILYSALSTCDPGDIMETIQKCKKAKIRCSVVGLSAEIYICKHLCQETGGSYTLALDESHFKELLLDHAPPPPAIAEFAVSNLIKMGFPQRAAEGVISICACHKEAKFGGGYTCPRCKARVCELPTECQICGLTLVSSPHLARSYHHLFPITPFNEVNPSLMNNPPHRLPKTCFGCQQSLLNTDESILAPKEKLTQTQERKLQAFFSLHAGAYDLSLPDSVVDWVGVQRGMPSHTDLPRSAEQVKERPATKRQKVQKTVELYVPQYVSAGKPHVNNPYVQLPEAIHVDEDDRYPEERVDYGASEDENEAKEKAGSGLESNDGARGVSQRKPGQPDQNTVKPGAAIPGAVKKKKKKKRKRKRKEDYF